MKKITLFLIVTLILAILSGCGDTPATSSSPSGTPSETSTSTTATSESTTTTSAAETTESSTTGSAVSSGTTTDKAQSTTTKTTTTTTKATKTTATTAPSRELGETVSPTPKTIHYIGRYSYLTSELEYAWKLGNSGVEFSFRGTSVSVDVAANTYPQQFRVWIDGKTTKTFVLEEAETIELAAGLKEGDHQCRLLKMNGPNGQMYVSKIRTSKGGTVYRSTGTATRKMLVIGDSITSGYGILEGNDAFLAEDGTQVYQQQAADLIGGIELQTVAQSGLGIARNAGNTKPHSGGALWMFNDYDFASSDFKPDLIVIALGTNDAAASDQEFVEDATTFLKAILEKYPGTPVIWSYGLMGQSKAEAIQSVIRRVSTNLKVDNIHFLLHQGPTGNEGIGLAGHPSLATHTRVAAELAAKMKEVMGW